MAFIRRFLSSNPYLFLVAMAYFDFLCSKSLYYGEYAETQYRRQLV